MLFEWDFDFARGLDFERVLAFFFDFIKTECKKAHGWSNSIPNPYLENLVTVPPMRLVKGGKPSVLLVKKMEAT